LPLLGYLFHLPLFPGRLRGQINPSVVELSAYWLEQIVQEQSPAAERELPSVPSIVRRALAGGEWRSYSGRCRSSILIRSDFMTRIFAALAGLFFAAVPSVAGETKPPIHLWLEPEWFDG